MPSFHEIPVPQGFDFNVWLGRWDAMQNRYLEDRSERFRIMIDIIRATGHGPGTIVELGCGTGSLLKELAGAFPKARLIGIDHDPTMLLLANARFRPQQEDVELLQADIRIPVWTRIIPSAVDAFVSATALHWLEEKQLARLYAQIGGKLKRGGVFLNADHAGCASGPIQALWDANKRRHADRNANSEDWNGFWEAYAKAIGLDIAGVHKSDIDRWAEGIEDGLPLSWHFDRLRKSGFSPVDCFWRKNGDAIYGGIKA